MDNSTLIRAKILETSLLIEKQTSVFLGALLGITDIKNSKTLSNSNSSLSFNTKIDLLIDIGALDSDKKSMFQTFMELRNQFMHNIDANTFENCVSFTNGKDSYLLKKYKQDSSLSKEEQLKNAIDSLSTDVSKLTMEISEKVKEKNRLKAEAEVNKISHDAYTSYFETPTNDMFKYFDEQVALNTTFDADRLRAIAFYVLNSIHEHWMEAFKKDELKNANYSIIKMK